MLIEIHLLLHMSHCKKKAGKIKLFPASESLVSDIPAGDRKIVIPVVSDIPAGDWKIANLFYSVTLFNLAQILNILFWYL